jgi:hypothetical protein
MRLPFRCARTIGKIALGEDFQARFVATEFGQQRIFAAEGDSRVENFDQQIDFGKCFRNFDTCFVHVSGKPIDRSHGANAKS